MPADKGVSLAYLVARLWKFDEDGRCILADDSVGQNILRLNKEAERTGRRLRVLFDIEPFKDSEESVFTKDGLVLHEDPNSGRWFPDVLRIGKSRITLNHLRRKLFRLIDATPWLDWLLPTEYPENVRPMWWRQCDCGVEDGQIHSPFCRVRAEDLSKHGRLNVWLMVVANDQVAADRLLPEAVGLRGLVGVLGVWARQLAGPIDLDGRSEFERRWDGHEDKPQATPWIYRLDFVAANGSVGQASWPMHPDWLRSLRNQAVRAKVPFHFGGWGDWQPGGPAVHIGERTKRHRFPRKLADGDTVNDGNGQLMVRSGYRKTGRLLDGEIWDQIPTVPGVQERLCTK